MPYKNKADKKANAARWHKLNKKRNNAISAAWRKRNPERAKQLVEIWVKNNKERSNEIKYNWAKEHPDEAKKASAKCYIKHKDEYGNKNNVYRKSHPEVAKAAKAKRRTSISKAGGSFTSEQWTALCKINGNRCLCCNRKKRLEADHVIPVSKGGTSNISNIQPLCRSCNAKKGTKSTDYRK